MVTHELALSGTWHSSVLQLATMAENRVSFERCYLYTLLLKAHLPTERAALDGEAKNRSAIGENTAEGELSLGGCARDAKMTLIILAAFKG